ncbi:MAG: SGNH/GDSL hydrolase family protein [Caldilineae bacterium]|nr:SGNH/GDSL hydrolase family protein [Anaerolineae bacterium]MCB0200765.1 SGNH/GDSL hydrolase family protein [Anaerolineae bacterium]MCB0203803.1 SGNH/GDSL hydrolase family protein [Anaerolineae bacterium]MCB0252289.1 SGNH/GDSL hydrolase family protein [Anaerolineae bacterium]MCB9154262.1 SGNH/GDSL hydrolase family protein [Caldilineae bacterium]
MRRYRVLVAILLGLVCVSVLLNVFLFNQTKKYYLDLNRERLDPLGLESHPLVELPGPGDSGEPTVVFLGDSRAAAWFPPSLPIGVRFINRGIDGQTSAQVRYRFDHDVGLIQPDVIVLQVGINDLKTIPLFPDQEDAIVERVKSNIAEIVAQARDMNAKVILTTVFPVGEIPLARRPFWSPKVNMAIDNVNAYIASLEGHDIVILDAYKVLSNETTTQDLYVDELHLNSAAYDLLNQEMGPLLVDVIETLE